MEKYILRQEKKSYSYMLSNHQFFLKLVSMVRIWVRSTGRDLNR